MKYLVIIVESGSVQNVKAFGFGEQGDAERYADLKAEELDADAGSFDIVVWDVDQDEMLYDALDDEDEEDNGGQE